jgi:hypothetical protein
MTHTTNKKVGGRSNDLRGSRRNPSSDQFAAWSTVLLLTLLITAVWGSSRSFADQPLPQQMVVAYKDGTITGVYETTIEIDRKTYTLAPDAILLGRRGKELDARHLRVDIEVKYHLEKGSTDKIDRMILYLPY